jgi:Spy/CpxP family protein refolding chaperone
MFRALAIFSVMAILVLPSAAQDVFYFNQAIGSAAMPLPFPAADEAIAAVQKALNLSEAQVTGLKALMNQRTEGSKTAFQDLAEKQKALQTVLAQQNPAALDIGNAYLALQSAQNTLKSAEQKFQTDFRALLTADQRTTLQNLQNASTQIESLQMLGVFAGGHSRFELPFPGPGPLGLGGGAIGIGAERSIHIFRKNEVPQR